MPDSEDPWDRFSDADLPPDPFSPTPAEDEEEVESKRPSATQVGSVLVYRDPDGDPVAVPAEVVHEAERAWRAWQAHLGGLSWTEVAAQENYPNGQAASADVALYLERGKSLVIERSLSDALAVELARLDALVVAHWDKATKQANFNSSRVILQTVKLRSALIGLSPEHLNSGSSEGQTVVIQVSEKGGADSFLERLKNMAEDA